MVKVQNRGIFGVANISNIFLGCLKFLIFFGGEREPMYAEKMRVPPWA